MSDIVENTEGMEPSKKSHTMGFGTGLGIGLSIGAVMILIAMIVEGVVLTKKLSYQGEVLDRTTIQKMQLVENVINKYFYDYTPEDEVTADDIRTGILDGMVQSLGDNYADYYTAEELEAVTLENQGIFYGVGATIMIDESGYGIFDSIMEDTPAEKAGLHAGDIIYEVDGELTYGMSLDEIVSKVRGDKDTVVHISIVRKGVDDLLEFDITRGPVPQQTVYSSMLDDNIGYIRIKTFEGVTGDQFKDCIEDLKDQGADGLIIDLRNNRGGLLTTVLNIGQQILPEGVIVYEEYADGQRKTYSCDGSNEIDIPLVVLVNEYSASASEILTGAIKDYEIGTIVGKTTFGKGIVQDTKIFSDGSGVKLTVAAYYSPKGVNIQGIGIEPDVEVDIDIDKYYDEGIDTQLEKAIEVIKSDVGQKDE